MANVNVNSPFWHNEQILLTNLISFANTHIEYLFWIHSITPTPHLSLLRLAKAPLENENVLYRDMTMAILRDSGHGQLYLFYRLLKTEDLHWKCKDQSFPVPMCIKVHDAACYHLFCWLGEYVDLHVPLIIHISWATSFFLASKDLCLYWTDMYMI